MRSPPEYSRFRDKCDAQQAALRAQAAAGIAQNFGATANSSLQLIIIQIMIAALLWDRVLPGLLFDELLNSLADYGSTNQADVEVTHRCFNILGVINPEHAGLIENARSKIPPMSKQRRHKNRR